MDQTAPIGVSRLSNGGSEGMTLPDNKALIEEAMRRVAELERVGLNFLGSFERLATALEAAETEREGLLEQLEVVATDNAELRQAIGDLPPPLHQDAVAERLFPKEYAEEVKRVADLQFQLQQTQARLEEAVKVLEGYGWRIQGG